MSDTWKVQIRDEKSVFETPGHYWDDTKGEPDCWLGQWRDTTIEGSEDYCRGWAEGAQLHADGCCLYKVIQKEEV